MTTQEILNLPTNKKTIEILRKQAIEITWLQDVILSFNSYLYLPVSIKKITTKPTVKSVYNSLIQAQKLGYRKELTLC
jgi:hypothetical protein